MKDAAILSVLIISGASVSERLLELRRDRLCQSTNSSRTNLGAVALPHWGIGRLWYYAWGKISRGGVQFRSPDAWRGNRQRFQARHDTGNHDNSPAAAVAADDTPPPDNQAKPSLRKTAQAYQGKMFGGASLESPPPPNRKNAITALVSDSEWR